MTRTIIIPQRFTADLVKLPEDGMGYQYVDVVLDDGRVVRQQVIIGASVWKTEEDVMPEMIVAVRKASKPRIT